ncbi:hypothetical protein [Labrys sp. ZIDIC5]|nr:hypothetical protein [Labrys sp. ZIDIC5]MDZ5448162.1 hypothetical protein [Labrys sp. ZIDIC5]
MLRELQDGVVRGRVFPATGDLDDLALDDLLKLPPASGFGN